ncbi:type III secretion system ATPase SctN [Pseudomonas plecoglossicida]|uniref:Type 3 secretion system ATPase n=1 Tax=Pseudomonas plecoglossicida TaxID=70775 RepID=A0AAD0QTZ4_PSEDL|nr:type III secretion system ATPase SctN [Pseudomonas plecoglossicida]AXM95543.1 EscN/YscN/HrcN family type III secretion system ATPase [Pseudomonas plecoglossicida]EPB94348.1 type III secretion system ATPase [Pseudomonas plecoglossicida NB2011]QLB56290.1 EscN/YscN/HrcN family type III secretion system ATPase [Pseudomonas plecoglossicida]
MHELADITGDLQRAIDKARLIQVRGKVIQATGTLLKAVIPGVHIGELCQLNSPSQTQPLLAEVIGFQQHQALLTPLGEILGLSSDTEVRPTGGPLQVAVGDHLLGKVLNGLGLPLDGQHSHVPSVWYPVYRDAPPPLSRKMIVQPISLGVRAIDGLLTCGEGQRLGIFAAAGGGKSTLLATLMRNANADVIVLGLIGERGREVREFIEHDLGEAGLRRSVVVVATSDRPAMERAKASFVATTIAEYFRDQGKRVLLLIDSVTRFARAQREIGLAAGEPPTRRGYPPSVYAQLPRLMERAGQSDKGSITALYTVLAEDEEMTDPIAEETRSILDGHIVLSHALAAANHYPAIDVLRSVSRVMNNIVSEEHRAAAGQVRQWLAKYAEMELLINIGEYKQGQDPAADRAVEKREAIHQWLRQGTHEACDLTQSVEQLTSLSQCA